MRPTVDIATKSFSKGISAIIAPPEKRAIQIVSIKEPSLKRPFDVFLSSIEDGG